MNALYQCRDLTQRYEGRTVLRLPELNISGDFFTILGENYLGAIPDTLLNDNPGELCVARMLVKKYRQSCILAKNRAHFLKRRWARLFLPAAAGPLRTIHGSGIFGSEGHGNIRKLPFAKNIVIVHIRKATHAVIAASQHSQGFLHDSAALVLCCVFNQQAFHFNLLCLHILAAF